MHPLHNGPTYPYGEGVTWSELTWALFHEAGRRRVRERKQPGERDALAVRVHSSTLHVIVEGYSPGSPVGGAREIQISTPSGPVLLVADDTIEHGALAFEAADPCPRN